jgi:phage terminase large subunit
MMRRKELDPEGYQIYGLGEWGELKGLILNNWEIKEVSFKFDDYDDIAIGQDFGFNHANAILILGIKDDQLSILDEIYEFEKESNEIIELSKRKNLPTNRDMWCDSAEPDRIKMWRKAGYYAKPVSKEQNSIQAQIDWLKGRKIFVHPHCINTIKEFQQWKWKYDDIRDIQLDVPVDVFDDAMAALRYGVEGWRKQKQAVILSKYEMYD